MRALLRAIVLTLATALPINAPAAVEGAAKAPEIAIVAQDRLPLRAAARESAQQHALLWAGESLEVRGRRLDYLQVYDHRRERAGFVLASAVRVLSAEPERADELLAVVRFLRELPGSEALGVGYVAAFLRAAPAERIDAEVFDALGSMADRLLRRASFNRTPTQDANLAAQVEVLRGYGVGVLSFEHEGRIQLCYEGEAFRRVLALPATPAQQARAALALTRPQCIDPMLNPLARQAVDGWRAEVLDRVDLSELPVHEQHRLRLRMAAVWSAIAHHRSRRGEPTVDAAERALAELAAVDRHQLAEGDAQLFAEAAVWVGASRWATEPAPAARQGIDLRLAAGSEPGQTCLQLVSGVANAAPLWQRCTFSTVWPASLRLNAANTLATFAVQPLPGWRELWVLQKQDGVWRLDVLPPSSEGVDLGYIEFAGWVPDSRKLLAAREVRVDGRIARSFELIDLDLMRVEKRAEEPEHLSPFYRHQDAAWKRMTVSLRK